MIRCDTKALFLLAFAGATLFASPAFAASYPVSGAWTYDNAAGKGPAKVCGPRQMAFSGTQRHDTEGGVHDYRNISVNDTGTNTWRIVDEFYNGQIWGRVTFTLTRQDDDHIKVDMARGGASFLLRRCE